MVMLVSFTLLGAPLANIRTKLADRFREPTVPCHRLRTEQADVNALTTTVWAIVVTIHVNHCAETSLTRDRAFLASINAILVATHLLGSPLKVDSFLEAVFSTGRLTLQSLCQALD